MKKIIPALVAITFLISCNDKKKTTSADAVTNTENNNSSSNEGSDEKIGEFSIDGKSVTGKAETQYFGDKEKGNFSVLCQHNESATSANFELLQATFVNEKDATSSPLKIHDSGNLPMTEPEAGLVAVSLSGVGGDLGDKQFTGSGKSTGSITVSNRVLTIKDLTLYNSEGKMKTVSARIGF